MYNNIFNVKIPFRIYTNPLSVQALQFKLMPVLCNLSYKGKLVVEGL
jgi:hypothetical protein